MVHTAKKIFFLFAIIIVAWFLHVVFAGQIILAQTFNFGPLTIHYYGIIMALAVLAGFYLAKKRAPLYGIEQSKADDLIFWLVIGGFIGARIYHVLSSINYYKLYPLDIFKVWNGGLSIYGAVFGGLIMLLLIDKNFKFQISNFKILDWLTPSLIVGQIIGRFGNLFNYEAFGYPTNLPWKMFVPFQFRPEILVTSNYFHPLFLYEQIGNVLILIFLIYFLSPRTRGDEKSLFFGSPSFAKASEGKLFFSYLLLYNVLRFLLESQRVDSTFIGNFRLNSITSLLLIIISFVFLFANKIIAKEDKP